MFPGPTELLLIGCLIESIWDTKIQIKYVDTKNQLADILTKGSFTRDEWNHLLTLCNSSHFSSTACIAAIAKRAQQESGEGRVTAKSRPMMNLTARMLSFVSSSASSNPGSWSWRIYENPNGTSSSQISWRSHCRTRYEFIKSLQSSAQIYSCASSNENTRCKGSAGKIIGKKLQKKNWHGSWWKSETKMKWSLKQGMRAE